MDEFNRLETAVLGMSADTVERQAKFRDKYRLNMPLLADPGEKTLTAYGVFKKKTLYGKTALGIERTTFIIGRDGTIKKIFPKVRVDGHVKEVLRSLANL
jgi:peroxiredoxin Q/BCP